MAGEATTYPLITAKLHRPPVDRIHVHRPHLLERLDQRRSRPLTLVSAPAGYGKSVLLRSWLKSCDIPSAWVSRMRPVTMAAITTVFGMTPFVTDAFFNGMAVTIMAGLSFATILILVVIPVLYAIEFNVNTKAPYRKKN